MKKENSIVYALEHLDDDALLSLIAGKKVKMGETLRDLLARSPSELVARLGKRAGDRISAMGEIARRFGQTDLVPGEPLKGSQQVFAHFHERLRHEKKEKFFSVLLDVKNRIIRTDLVSVGSLNLSIVHPREVFGPALRESAAHIIFVHNHPSGDPTPSKEDIVTTERLVAVGRMVGIEVLDHIVIGDGRYASFAEQKLLKQENIVHWFSNGGL